MKKLKGLLLVIVSLWYSCDNPEKEQTETITSFIPGTYVREFEGEYSFGHDTLIISQLIAGSDVYKIKHNISFRKVRKKTPQPKESKSENWFAIWNKSTHVLLEQNKGKQMIFSPDKNEVLLGNSAFQKLNK